MVTSFSIITEFTPICAAASLKSAFLSELLNLATLFTFYPLQSFVQFHISIQCYSEYLRAVLFFH